MIIDCVTPAIRELLMLKQRPSGAWGYHAAQDSVETTCFAILALRRTDEILATAVPGAARPSEPERKLARLRRRRGGWDRGQRHLPSWL